MEFWTGWKYWRIDWQPIRLGWRLWFYQTWYDGRHYALHLGPIVLGHGDGIPPGVMAQPAPDMENSPSEKERGSDGA